MRFRNFLVIFGFVLVSFTFGGCVRHDFVWSFSNGILTYNRATGVLEVMWESEHKAINKTHDTVYVCKDSIPISVSGR